MHKRVLIESQRATGAKVKVKSCLGVCVNPLATSHALNCEIVPSLSRLMCKTHLHCTGLRSGGIVKTSS
jgi:hypothetical protein